MSDLKDDFYVDLTRSVLWQYSDAESLKKLIELKNNRHNKLVSEFINDWFHNVFNVDTANDFGLSVWARILNLQFEVEREAQPNKAAWGVGPNRRNFAKPSNFGMRGGETLTLNLEQKRLLVKFAAFKTYAVPTLDNLNDFLLEHFGVDENGNQAVYTWDNLDMSQVLYTFGVSPDMNMRLLIEFKDILPRPSAVGFKTRDISKKSWGVGPNRRNFASPSNFGVVGL